MAGDPYDPILRSLVREGLERLQRRLRDDAPTLANHVDPWISSLSGGLHPEAYFLDPSAFPMLLLPWWYEDAIADGHDVPFGRDLVYSTVTGYYVVRLVDDLMDGDAPVDPPVTPAIIVLHTEFLGTYHRHFPAGHPLWGDVIPLSYASAEMASSDAALQRIDRATFERISARKTIGAKIPLAAMAHRHGERAGLGPWLDFVDVLGRWHQMTNDVRDWARDLDAGRATYFLSEAKALTGSDGSIAGWILSDGLTWAYGELDRWMDELTAMSAQLDSRPLMTYLEDRARSAADERRQLFAGLPALRRLADAIG